MTSYRAFSQSLICTYLFLILVNDISDNIFFSSPSTTERKESITPLVTWCPCRTWNITSCNIGALGYCMCALARLSTVAHVCALWEHFYIRKHTNYKLTDKVQFHGGSYSRQRGMHCHWFTTVAN